MTERVRKTKLPPAPALPDGVYDGGAESQTHPNYKSAYGSVSAANKRRAFIMLGAAGVTLCVLWLSRLIWLLEPQLDKIRYATVSEIIYYGILAVIFIGYAIGLDKFLSVYCGVHIFRPKRTKVSIPCALGVIALCAAAMFIASAALGLKFKMELEIGYGVTATSALINVATYLYYMEHIFMGFIAATLVQIAASTLLPAARTVPWGAVFLVTVFGLVEFTLEIFTTTHAYPWLYYLFTYVYAAVYILTGRSFHVSFWASVILMVL